MKKVASLLLVFSIFFTNTAFARNIQLSDESGASSTVYSMLEDEAGPCSYCYGPLEQWNELSQTVIGTSYTHCNNVRGIVCTQMKYTEILHTICAKCPYYIVSPYSYTSWICLVR